MVKALVLALVCTPALAGPYVEFGVGGTVESCIRDYDENKRQWGCSDSPLGIVAAGYRHGNFSIHAEHMSSLKEKDPGLNVISIRYRKEWE
jgi:hypothetical protein